jgi:hypothetical protein
MRQIFEADFEIYVRNGFVFANQRAGNSEAPEYQRKKYLFYFFHKTIGQLKKTAVNLPDRSVNNKIKNYAENKRTIRTNS